MLNYPHFTITSTALCFDFIDKSFQFHSYSVCFTLYINRKRPGAKFETNNGKHGKQAATPSAVPSLDAGTNSWTERCRSADSFEDVFETKKNSSRLLRCCMGRSDWRLVSRMWKDGSDLQMDGQQEITRIRQKAERRSPSISPNKFEICRRLQKVARINDKQFC